MHPWTQAAGEYAAIASRSADGPVERTRLEGLDRVVDALEVAWDTATGFAVEHPALAVLAVLVIVVFVERLLTRRSWRF